MQDIIDIVLTKKDKQSIYKCVCFNVIGKDKIKKIKVDFNNKIFKFKRLNGSKFLWINKQEKLSFKEVALMAKEFIYQRANIDLISRRNFCKYTYENGDFANGSFSEEDAIISATYEIIDKLEKQGRL